MENKFLTKPVVQLGDYAFTPYEPRGLVKVIKIYDSKWPSDAKDDRSLVDVLYLHEHYGYAANSVGTYYYEELERVEETFLAIVNIPEFALA